jgi:O-antigen/teichoic acid export membrane protein
MVKHAGLDAIGTVVSSVVILISSVIVTRSIGVELFGKYALSQSMFMVVGVFAVFGLNTGIVRLTSKYNARNDLPAVKGTLLSGISLSALFSTVLAVAVIALAPVLASRVFTKAEGIDWVVRIHFIGLPFFALMMVLNGYTQGMKTLKYTVIVEFISRPVIRLAAIVVFILMGLKLAGVLYATVLSFVAAAAIAFYFARRVSPFDFAKTPTQPMGRELLIYSLPLLFARFTNVILPRFNMLLVGYFTDSTDTGLFGAAAIVSPFISMGLVSFGKIFAPVISELWELGRQHELEENLKTVTKWIFSVSYPIFMLVLVLSPSILRIFGKDFQGASETLRVLAAGQMANSMVGPLGYLMTMTGRQKLNLWNAIGFGVLNIGLNILLIPRYNIMGAAVAGTVSLAVLNLVRVVQVKIIYGFTPFRLDFLKPTIAGLIGAAVVYGLNAQLGWYRIRHTLALCAVFGLIYLVVLYAFGLKEEKKVLAEILRRRK